MQLLYDERDDAIHEARGSRILYWLDDLGAQPLSEAMPGVRGYLFAGARSTADYTDLLSRFPLIRDRVDERAPLLRLDCVLDELTRAEIEVPTPRTWRLPLDSAYPDDLTFPLFVRAAHSSFKMGGAVSRVRNLSQLEEEMLALRRALGWDALILARQWHDFVEAGMGRHGPVPQEVRVWIVDGEPFAWSFHYMNVVSSPKGFPPPAADLRQLASLGRQVGSAFRSRCVAADFAREKHGGWTFVEAGPGSCSGTAHEAVFKSVASRLRGDTCGKHFDALGGIFE